MPSHSPNGTDPDRIGSISPDELIRQQPLAAQHRYHLIELLQREGRLSEAVDLLDASLDIFCQSIREYFQPLWIFFNGICISNASPDRYPAKAMHYTRLVQFGNGALASGQFDAAESFYRKAIDLRPLLPFARIRLAHLFARTSRHEEADALFVELAQEIPWSNRIIRLSRDFLASLKQDYSAPCLAHEAVNCKAPIILLIACDPVYFRRFAAALLRSFLRHAGLECMPHFHIVNPDSFIPEEIALLRESLGIEAIGYTFEHIELAAFSSRTTPDNRYFYRATTYYACARFLQLPTILRRYGKPVLVVDADLLFIDSLQDKIEWNADVLLNRHASDYRNWIGELFAAACLYVRPGKGGLSFASLVAGYIDHFLRAGECQWFLDQIALFAAHGFHAGGREGSPAIGYFPEPLISEAAPQDEEKPSAPIWSITWSREVNRNKTGMALFHRHLCGLQKVKGWWMPAVETEMVARLSAVRAERRGRAFDGEKALAMLLEHCGSRESALDIGAGIGVWSWAMQSAFGRVEAVEPSGSFRMCCERNAIPGLICSDGLQNRKSDKLGLVRLDLDRAPLFDATRLRSFLLAQRAPVLLDSKDEAGQLAGSDLEKWLMENGWRLAFRTQYALCFEPRIAAFLQPY